jgi:3-oxoacyl-[acyl-carrier protein] reductase
MNPIVSLQDRTIVVTGAGQGIGKGLVELAIELGANVVAVDLNGETLQATTAPFPQQRVLAVQGSVADPKVADRAVADALTKFGAVHGLVNNAGIIRPAMIEKMTDQQWQEVIDVHLTGSFYWMRAVGKHMVERSKGGDTSGGSVVNISSDAGRKGSIGFGVVETPMTEVVRGEKFRDGMLAQIPLGRWSTPAEVVKSVCFLLSDGASYITGQHLAVNGGFHISL